jgi:hypothetical protein
MNKKLIEGHLDSGLYLEVKGEPKGKLKDRLWWKLDKKLKDKLEDRLYGKLWKDIRDRLGMKLRVNIIWELGWDIDAKLNEEIDKKTALGKAE